MVTTVSANLPRARRCSKLPHSQELRITVEIFSETQSTHNSVIFNLTYEDRQSEREREGGEGVRREFSSRKITCSKQDQTITKLEILSSGRKLSKYYRILGATYTIVAAVNEGERANFAIPPDTPRLDL